MKPAALWLMLSLVVAGCASDSVREPPPASTAASTLGQPDLLEDACDNFALLEAMPRLDELTDENVPAWTRALASPEVSYLLTAAGHLEHGSEMAEVVAAVEVHLRGTGGAVEGLDGIEYPGGQTYPQAVELEREFIREVRRACG